MSRLTIYRENYTDSTIVSNQFIDEYMKDANDAQIKIYLYLLRMMSSNLPTSISEIADKFNHTEKDVLRALAYWEKQNLMQLDYDDRGEVCGLHMKSAQPMKEGRIVPLPKALPTPVTPSAPLAVPAPASSAADVENRKISLDKPSYSLDDVAAFKKDETASQILFIAESYLGRTLSATDIKTLLFIYKELQFSTELIDYLIEYCVGKGKREMRYIEKVAVNWATEHITSVRQAKNRSTRYDKLVYTVMKALGRDSNPTSREAEFIHRWNRQYGFSQDMILAACEKTVLAVDSHRFEYTEGILSKWQKSGIRTMNDVKNAQDSFQRSKAAHSTAKPTNSFNNFPQRDYNFDELEKELLSN